MVLQLAGPLQSSAVSALAYVLGADLSLILECCIMSNDVLKAGVLEVTVVQAIGVGLQGSGTALARR